MQSTEMDHVQWIGKHLPCPKCGSKDNASYNEYGVWHCFGCLSDWYDESYDTRVKGNEQTMNYYEQQFEQQEPKELPEGVFCSIPDRNLSEDTCRKYGVTCDLDLNGKVLVHHYPYCDDRDEVFAVKSRNADNKTFAWSGQARQVKQFFGQSKFQPKTAGNNILFICEGCIDAMSVYQLTGYPAVSVPNGATSLLKTIKENYDYVNSFDKIFICMDNDKVGREQVELASSVFPPRKTYICYSDKAKGCKDPNDYLKKNLELDFKKDMWWGATQFIPDGIFDDPGAIWEEVKGERNKGGGHPYPWAGLNKLLYGMSRGELITVTAGTGCVDKDTEYFDGTKWKKISEYTTGDLVLQYDTNTRTASMVEPLRYIKEPCSQMYHFKTKYGLDMMLCSEHNILYLTDKNNFAKKTTAEVIKVCDTTVKGFQGRIPCSFKVDNTSSIPLSDLEIQIMLAVIADGYLCSKTQVQFHLKKQRKKTELRSLLEQAGIHYTWSEDARGYANVRFVPPLHTKEFAPLWYKANNRQLQVICDNVLKWDGCTLRGRRAFFTTNKTNADFIQFAFSACGYRARITEQDRRGRVRTVEGSDYRTKSVDYIVTVARKGYTTMINRNTKPYSLVDSPDGYKYCFTVPSSNLVLRRNGCIFVTGNCGKSQWLRELQYHLLKTTDDRIGLLMLEETVGRTALGLMSIEANTPLHKPDTFVSDEELKMYYDRTIGLGKISFYGGFKSFDIETIKARIEYMIQGCDCKYIFLDHISILVSNQEVSDERKTLDAVAHCLAELAVSYNVCIIMVSHLRRNGSKPHEEGGQTSLQDLRGTQGIGQLSFTVIGLERNQQAENPDERNKMIVRVLKNRKFGETGPACVLEFNQETGRLSEVADEASVEPEQPEVEDYKENIDG